MSTIQDVAIKYLKKDLLFFLVVLIVFVALLAGLYLWDKSANVLAPFTDRLLNFLQIQL